jgi:hypothetical protein
MEDWGGLVRREGKERGKEMVVELMGKKIL